MRTRISLGVFDLIVGLFLCGVIVSVTIPFVQGARDVANKAKCASNLHQLGLAILLYQNDNNQSYPRTVTDTTGDPRPTWGTPYDAKGELGPIKDANPFDGGKAAPAANDVSAAFFLLLRNEQITPQVFVCPSTKLKAWDFGGKAHTAQDWTNWQTGQGLADHLSYSYQNPYPSNQAIANGFQIKNPDATFAIASDMNPGVDAVLKVTMQSSMKEMQAANSLNHRQEGQNVLYGDGHAEYQSNPFCGTQHDNIFTAFGPVPGDEKQEKAVVVSSSRDGIDSILLPTAANIGYTGQPKLKPLSDSDLARMKKDILGNYSAPLHGKLGAVLTIEQDTIKCESGPLTILYHYEVAGTENGTMLLKLTASKTNETGSLTLEGKNLTLDITGDFPLDFPWVKN